MEQNEDLKFPAPTTGTTGYREDLEVVSIPMVGKSSPAPDYDPINWSAGNPFND